MQSEYGEGFEFQLFDDVITDVTSSSLEIVTHS